MVISHQSGYHTHYGQAYDVVRILCETSGFLDIKLLRLTCIYPWAEIPGGRGAHF